MDFVPDSKVVERVEPSKGFRGGHYLPRGEHAARAVVIHTTGPGPGKRVLDPAYARWRRKQAIHAGIPGWTEETAAFEAALWIYVSSGMKAGPHYVVGQEPGLVAQVCPEDHCAWHVGGKGSRIYQRSNWPIDGPFLWWDARFEELSPRDLAGGHLWDPYTAPAGFSWGRQRARLRASYEKGSCNANSIGIEVVPRVNDPRGPWTTAAWNNLTPLLLDITGRNAIPRHPSYIFTHSDAHPAARTTKSGLPWDTTPAQFVYDELALREPRFR